VGGEPACILRQVGNGEVSQCSGEVKAELRLKVKVKVKVNGHVGWESFVDPRTCTVCIFVVCCVTRRPL